MADPFSVDERQLDRILKMIEPAKPRWSIDDVTKLIQLFAVIAAALWGIYLYLSFDKRAHEISLALSDNQRKIAEFEAQQLATTERMRTLDLRLKEVDVTSKTSHNLKHSLDVVAEPLDEAVQSRSPLVSYRVSVSAKFTNGGSLPVSIDYTDISIYLGAPTKRMSREGIWEVTLPDENEEGVPAYTWTPILSRSYSDRSRSSGGIGLLGPTETSHFNNDYVLTTKRGTMVAAHVTIHATVGDDTYAFFDNASEYLDESVAASKRPRVKYKKTADIRGADAGLPE